VKITWDSKAKIVYIYIQEEGQDHLKTVEIFNSEGNINIDYAANGNVSGIEILNTTAPVIVE